MNTSRDISSPVSKPFPKKLVLLLIVLSLITCGSLILIFSIFTVHKISIQGAENIRGVERYIGKSTLMVSTHSIAQDLKRDNARILDIVVEKKYPDHIIMHITVKKASVQVKLADGFVVLASDGYVLEKVKQEQNDKVPLIQYYQPLFYNQYHVGDSFDNADIRVATSLSGSMLDMGVKVSGIDIASENMIVLHSEDFDVFTTSEKDADKQFREFEYTYKQLKIEGTKFSSIDVRFEKPIIKLL